MNKGIIAGIIAAVVIVGGVLASPLFYETEVDEPLPVSLDNLEKGLTLEKFSNMDEQERQVIVEKMPENVKDMIMKQSSVMVKSTFEQMDEMMDKDSTEQAVPEIIKTGEFEGLAGHQAMGTAKLIQVSDMTFLRFEDFEVTNGPDLRVYVTQNGDVHDGIHLEKLKGSRGSQNYSLEGINVDVYDTVVIYCQPFGVYFAQANLM